MYHPHSTIFIHISLFDIEGAMEKQVNSTHYQFGKYVTKGRWASLWHQLDEVIKLKPKSVLEVGPGPGLFKAAALAMGVHVETLDLDPELHPDHVASVLAMPFSDGAFDVVCAFQMLEHLPFAQSVLAFKEMVRTSRDGVVISLPDAGTRWRISVNLPRIGRKRFLISRPQLSSKKHVFNGQHYWELNKTGYLPDTVIKRFLDGSAVALVRKFRVPEYPRHHFFVFHKIV